VEPLEDRRLLSNLVALSTDNQLLAFDSAAPGTIEARRPVTGLQPGEALLGIDFRPSTGQLYALGSSDRLYVIDPTSGAATPVGTAPFAVPLSGTAFGFNFDPAADQIRVVSDAGQNLRLDPNTGAKIDADPATPGTQLDADLNPPGHVVAVAYTFAAGGAGPTLYGIDSASDEFVRIGAPGGNPSPDLGAVTPVAPLGAATSDQVGLDIAPDNTGYAALSVGGTAELVRVGLTTGPSPVGTIGDGSVGIRGLAGAPPGPVEDAAAGREPGRSYGALPVGRDRRRAEPTPRGPAHRRHPPGGYPDAAARSLLRLR
jgi:hypothetical protein